MLPECLSTAAALRVPVFEKGTPSRAKVDALEEYTLLSAYWQGECHQERLGEHGKLDDAQHEWDHLAGWEAFRRSKTETAVEDAKRQIRPDLYDTIQRTKRLVARLSEEIDRLERDAAKVSRAYTMIVGG